jgi:predicted amidophosphoribosyltransferase
MITYRKRRSREDRVANEVLGLPADFRIPFGACYAYSPKGGSETSERSRLLCNRVKNGSSRWLESYATRVYAQARQKRCFCELFSPNTTLVPIPKCRSAPGPSGWVARRLAVAIKTTGLGNSVWTGLQRVTQVGRSSSAWMWERPTVQQHFKSFAVIPPASAPTEIILIDDVVTKGRTLVAAAIRLHLAFPQARIRAFALVRTMGLVLDVDRVFDPCRGEIRWDGMDARRDP